MFDSALAGMRSLTVSRFGGPEVIDLTDGPVPGRLTLRVAEELPLTEAAKAHELVEAGGHRGCIVLVP
jgi:NADPH2:quinone reductase